MREKSWGLQFRGVPDKSRAWPPQEVRWRGTSFGEDSRTAFWDVRRQGVTRAHGAGRGDLRASAAPRKRHFQQPSDRKPIQLMQMRPATASSPKSFLPKSFKQQAFNKMV